jgi:hypothetical protein
MDEFKAAMRMMFRVETLTGKLAPDFLTAAWQEWLDHVVTTVGAELLVVDTTRKAWNGNENDSGEVNELLAVFDGVSLRTGCSVLLTVHTNKYAAANGTADTAAATRGSSAFNDNGRANFYLRGMTIEDASGEKGGTARLVDLDRRREITTKQGDDGSRADYKSFAMFGGTKTSYSEEQDGIWLRREAWHEIGSIEGFGGTLGLANLAPEGVRRPDGAKKDAGAALTPKCFQMLGASKAAALAAVGSDDMTGEAPHVGF